MREDFAQKAVVAAVCLIAVGVLIFVLKNQPGPEDGGDTDRKAPEVTDRGAPAPVDSPGDADPSSGHPSTAAKGTDVSPAARPAAPPKDHEKLPKTHPQRRYGVYMAEGYGRAEPVRREDSIAAAAVFEALETQTHPERISAMVQKPFDADAYANDPDYKARYLSLSEPGRCWQAAQPGEGVPHIKRISPYYQKAHQSDSVELSVQAAARLPVTFTSFSGGTFANKLTSITVEADSRGFASVGFTPGPGVVADCSILAASPGASSTCRMKVDVFKDDEDLNEE